MAAARGTVTLHVSYTHDQIVAILQDRAKEDLKEQCGGKEPVGSSTVRFSGKEMGTDWIVSAAVDYQCNLIPARK